MRKSKNWGFFSLSQINAHVPIDPGNFLPQMFDGRSADGGVASGLNVGRGFGDRSGQIKRHFRQHAQRIHVKCDAGSIHLPGYAEQHDLVASGRGGRQEVEVRKLR